MANNKLFYNNQNKNINFHVYLQADTVGLGYTFPAIEISIFTELDFLWTIFFFHFHLYNSFEASLVADLEVIINN